MYSVDVKHYSSSFSVPAKIADEMLKLCSGEQLKVILCILRNPEITAEGISAKTGLSLDIVLECAEYWTDCGIIKSEEAKVSITSEKEIAENTSEISAPKIIPMIKPTQGEIDSALENSRSLRNLFLEAEQILGKTLGYSTQCVIFNIVNYYGLSKDVANMLLTFAKYADATSQQELYSIAKSWADNGITDCASANEYIDKATKARKLYSALAKKTGNSDTNPTFAQYDYLFKWLNWGFKADAVVKAHEIMKSEKETGTLNYRNFQYMDKILKNWHENSLHTLSEIEAGINKAVKKPTAKKNNKEVSFDLEKVKEASRDRTRDIGNMKNRKKRRA